VENAPKSINEHAITTLDTVSQVTNFRSGNVKNISAATAEKKYTADHRELSMLICSED